MITLNNIDELDEKTILRIVEKHKSSVLPRLLKLERYYHTDNDINRRQMSDPTKPNNKVANAYASYITDTLVGYFVGEPISYSSNDEEKLKELQMILEYNDEADENTELAKSCSIFGVGFELLYFGEEDKMIRFTTISPKEGIPIFDKTVEHSLLAFIRYYDDYDITTDKTETVIEVITDTSHTTYKTNTTGNTSLRFIDSYNHYFGMVPVAIYKNNNEEIGDFEPVISLIDAYDKMESDSLNDFEYSADAYLCLYGFTADTEDIKQMKENRVLLMDEGTNAEWLIKNASDTNVENQKIRLDQDIHKFAKCPNLTDDNFAGNTSGIAIEYKTLGTENLVSIKERKFKRGLQQRFELIAQMNSILGDGFDWRSIDIHFKRNLPANETDLANMVDKLNGIVSAETLLAQLPFVEDPQEEIRRVEEAKQKSPFYNDTLSLYQENYHLNKVEADNE